jgi:hypothetical protein
MYWHIGDIAMRFEKVTDRSVNGEKRGMLCCRAPALLLLTAQIPLQVLLFGNE